MDVEHMPDAPVEQISPEEAMQNPERGIGLCLSGGGYRAMVFHVGAIWRLHQTGLLAKVNRISSVSGGSITAGVLALKWKDVSSECAHSSSSFIRAVVDPIRALASETIDAGAVILGIALPGRISDRVAAAYKRHLFGDATLQDLPDEPRFVINATNVQSGALWRFMKPYMRDYRVGEVKQPTIPLAQAVAASSAFAPIFSPFEMRLDPKTFTENSGQDLQRPPFTSKVLLTDGGVYDNLGLETVWKRYDTVLVSDGGAKIQAEEEPKSDWARHSYRVFTMVDDQVRSLRKRQTINAFKLGARKGAYWGIRTDIGDYQLSSALPCPHAQTMELAKIPTRLKRLDDHQQERLINWGYAVCDAALRKHIDAGLTPSAGFPYPARGV